jgi:hypothetical protein
MAHNPKFHGLLRDMAEMHDRKNNDYASAGNPYANFEFAGQLAAGFTAPVDIAFATLIGVKLARLIELKGKGKTPRNESIQDSFLDLAVYAALWASYDYEVKEERLPDVALPTERQVLREYLARVDRQQGVVALAAALDAACPGDEADLGESLLRSSRVG